VERIFRVAAHATGASPCCDDAVLPVHFSCAGNIECIANAPCPPRGTGGARGGIEACKNISKNFGNYEKIERNIKNQ
jgi:hypothetical protein